MSLLPYALAENWLDTTEPNSHAPQTWAQTIGSDPQNYLAIAAWYHDLGAWQSSDSVLNAAIASVPPEISPLVYYYLAANSGQEGDLDRAALLGKGSFLPVAQVFPNTMDAAILTEAVDHNPHDLHQATRSETSLRTRAYDEAAAQ
jgi:hypothetical protein